MNKSMGNGRCFWKKRRRPTAIAMPEPLAELQDGGDREGSHVRKLNLDEHQGEVFYATSCNTRKRRGAGIEK